MLFVYWCLYFIKCQLVAYERVKCMLSMSRTNPDGVRSKSVMAARLAGLIVLGCLCILSLPSSAKELEREREHEHEHAPSPAMTVRDGGRLLLQRDAFGYGRFPGAPVAAFRKSDTEVTVVRKRGGIIDIARDPSSAYVDEDKILNVLQQPGMRKWLEWNSAVPTEDGAVVSLAGVWQQEEGISSMNLSEFLVVRHDAARRLDRHFGKGGMQRIPLTIKGLGILLPNSVVGLTSGKLAVMGYVIDERSGLCRAFVLRLAANGAIDPKFGRDGLLVLGDKPDIAPIFSAFNMAAAPLDDGALAIVTVSGAGVYSKPVMLMSVIGKDGSVVRRVRYDSILAERPGYGAVFAPAILRRAPDGSFYLGGAHGAGGGRMACGIVHLTKNQEVDTSFGTRGLYSFVPDEAVECRMSDVLLSGNTIYVSGYLERESEDDGIFVEFFITHMDADRTAAKGASLPMDFTAASRDLRVRTSNGNSLVPLSDGAIAAVYHCEFETDQRRGECSGGNVVKLSIKKAP